jgi:hypothetical protein
LLSISEGYAMTKTPEVSRDEIRAIDAIWDAYLAVNATDSKTPSQLPWSPRHDGHADPMELLAESARACLRILGFTRGQARKVWHAMCDNGSGAEWNIGLLRQGII